MQITFDRKTINECLLQKFALPTFQRDYKWELKHLADLLTDIQEAFLSEWEKPHGRGEVLGYDFYFLGTIITTDVGKGGKAIIDGQQRITTLLLLMSYIHRIGMQLPDQNFSPVASTIRRQIAGKNQYNLEMDATRQRVFDILLDDKLPDDDLPDSIESIPNLDPGSKKLWDLYQSIPSLISDVVKENNLLAFLADYITERVCLFEIGVPKEQDGHKVFVTMNDRGLKLTPIDLLKGFLLSSIPIDSENKLAHASWTTVIRKLQDVGSDEDSNFIKTWLRAKYARTIRGKRRGDEPGDFELIGDSYHRWVMDNKEALELRTSDDFYELLITSLPFYANIYVQMKKHEAEYSPDFPHVYYNGARGLTLQTMAVMSAIKVTDSAAEVSAKIKGISYYLDHLATARVTQGKENTYDNIRDIIFEFSSEIRDLDKTTLQLKLTNKASTPDLVVSLDELSYRSTKRQDLLHLMARLADAVEQGINLTNSVGFSTYIDRSKDNKNFDVEHLLAATYGDINADIKHSGGKPFTNYADFSLARSHIGGLILLPRGRNRSLRAMRYSQKRERYASENVLASSLTDAFYLNNPGVKVFLEETGVGLKPHAHIDALAIKERGESYQRIAQLIWHDTMVSKVMQ